MLKRPSRLALHRYAALEAYEPDTDEEDVRDTLLVAANELMATRSRDSLAGTVQRFYQRAP